MAMKDIHKSYIPLEREEGFLQRQVPRLKTLVLILIVGVVLATQIYNPNKRVIEAMAGLLLISIMWRFSILPALWMFLIMYPFPFAISWGTSNEIFVLVIILVATLRVSTREHTFSIDRKIRLPLLLMVFSYLFSFLNVTPELTHYSLVNTFNFLTAAMFMLLIINFVTDEKKLRKTLQIMMISVALFIAFTIFEMLFPGRTIIPNWLYTTHRTRLIMKDIRMGGPFHDYELAAEFFTLNAFFIFFLFLRSKRMLFRALFGALLLVDLFMMFTTITRGALFSLLAGTAYLVFLSRKELNAVRLTYIVGGLVLTLFVMEWFVATYTTSGSLFSRVVETTFERGLIPTNRVGTWEGAFERGMENPIFGHGAGWDVGGKLWFGLWPHSLYLFYFNITGLFGLGAFILLVSKLLRSTMSGLKTSLVSSPFPEAFMKIMHVVLIIFLFDQIKIEYLRNSMYTYFIWFMFGLIIATHNIIIKQRNGRKTSDLAAAAAGQATVDTAP